MYILHMEYKDISHGKKMLKVISIYICIYICIIAKKISARKPLDSYLYLVVGILCGPIGMILIFELAGILSEACNRGSQLRGLTETCCLKL